MAALDQQGPESICDFNRLADKDNKNISANVWKPVGTIPNPNAATANQPDMITNQGAHLGYVNKQRLEILWLYEYHCVRIHLEFELQQMILARLQQVYHLKKSEDIVKEETIRLTAAITKFEAICT